MSQKMYPEISIIVPVYNTAELLPRCLDSILAQSFTDWECILVDDGSTDKSLEVAQQYAAQDGRFIVATQENQGVSAARNQGIDRAQGKWVAFVDSDDAVMPDYLKSMLQTAVEHNATLIVCGIRHCMYNKETVDYPLPPNYINKKDARFYAVCNKVHRSTWAKLYKKEVLLSHSIRFDESIDTAEDVLFYLTYLNHSDNIASTSYVGYVYYQAYPKATSSLSLQARKSFDYELAITQKIQTLVTQCLVSSPDRKDEILKVYMMNFFLCSLLDAALKETKKGGGFKKRVELLARIPTVYMDTKKNTLALRVRFWLLKQRLPCIAALTLANH